MNKLLRVPFSYVGYVDIECTEKEYEDINSDELHDRAVDELAYIDSLEYVDFDGFDFTSAEWVDEE